MGEIDSLSVRVGADTTSLRRDFGTAEQRVDQFAQRVDRSLGQVDGAFDRLNATAGRLGGVLAGLATIQTAEAVIKQADAWNLSASKIALYTGSAQQAAAVQEQLFQVAQRSRSALEPTVGLYTSLADAMLGMGKGQSDVIRLAETINKTFKISGTEAGAAAGALTQLAQAMGSGVLRGDEFNSVMEASPRLAKALADGLAVPRGALKSLAEQGQLTAEKVIGALTRQSVTIDAEFGRLATTVGDSMQVLGNAAQRQIGRLDQTTGATAGLSRGILALADDLDTVASVAGQTALALGAVGAARLLPVGAQAGVQALTRAIDDVRVALYAKAVATAEAANAQKLAAFQDFAARKGKAELAAATAQAAQAEIGGKLATSSAAATNLASAEASLTQARAKLVGATNIYVVNKALAAEREAEIAVVMAREASISADAEKAASLARLRVAQAASAVSAEAVAAADVRLIAASEGAQAASVALAQRVSLLSAAWGGLKAVGSSALALIGGPLGAAMLAGAGVAYLYASRTTEAEAATEAFSAAQQAVQAAVQGSASDVEALAKQYAGLSDSMRAVTRLKLEDALGKQADAVAAQRKAALAAVYSPTDSPLRVVEGNHGSDNLPEVQAFERMGLAADQVDKLRAAFNAFRDAAKDDPEAIAALVRTLDGIGRAAGDAGKPLVALARKLADPATKAEEASRAAKELAARIALLVNPSDDAAKAVLAAGLTAEAAASRFDKLGLSTGAVASKLTELASKKFQMSLPEGLERRVGEMVGAPPEAKTPVVTGFQDRSKSADDSAIQVWDATRDVLRQRLKNDFVPAEGKEALRLLQLETEATEKLARARASNSPAAMKEAEAEAEVVRRLREGFDPAQEGALRTALLTKARKEFGGEVGAQAQALGMDVAAQQRLTDAAGKGEAAQRAAAAANRIAAASLKGYGDAAAKAEGDLERLAVGQIRADTDRPILDQIKNQQALIAAYERGPAAVQAVEIAEKAHAAALKEGAEGTANYNEAKAHYIDLLSKAAKLEGAAAAGPMLQQQRDQLALGKQQLALMSKSAEARAVELARTQALIDLRGKNISATSAEGQAYLANAEALARQGLEIERSNAAYQELEQFGDRAFDAVLTKMVAAKDGTVDLREAVSALGTEFQQLALKMLALNPIKNAVFGANLPTVADMPLLGGGGGSAGQGGSNAGGSLTNFGLSKAGGWAADKLGLSGGWDGLMNTSLWGAQGHAATSAESLFSAGQSGAFVNGTWQTGAGTSAESLFSAGQSGAFVNGAWTPATSTPGVTVGGALGAAGGGFLAGSLIGGAIGTNANSKLAGAGSGVLSGAAAGALYGSIVPGIGTAIGAVVGAIAGALGGALGTQKASVGPTGQAVVFGDVGGKLRFVGAAADNEGDAGPATQAAQAAIAAVNATYATYGGSMAPGFGNNPGVVQQKGKFIARMGDDQEIGKYETAGEAAAAFAKAVLSTATNDLAPDIKTALANTASTTIEELGKDIDLAGRIGAADTALKTLDLSLAGIAGRAKDAAAQTYAAAIEEKKRADGLGLGARYAEVAEKQIRQSWENATVSWSPLQVALAEADGKAQALKDAITAMGLAISGAEVDAALAAEKARLRQQTTAAAVTANRDLRGVGAISAVESLAKQFAADMRDWGAQGLDTTILRQNFDLSLKKLFGDLKPEELDAVIRELSGAGVTLDGAGAEMVAALTAVATATRTAATAAATQATLQATVTETRQTYITALQAEATALQQVADRAAKAGATLRQFRDSLLTNTSLSPLSPGAQKDEAFRQLKEAAATAKGRDQDAALAAMERLPTLAQAALEASKAQNATTEDYTRDFDAVRGILDEAGTVADQMARIATDQLAVQRQQLTALGVVDASVRSVESALAAYNAARIAAGQPTIATGSVSPVTVGNTTYAAGSVGAVSATTPSPWVDPNYQNSVTVNGAYQAVFGRAADPTGLANWLGVGAGGELSYQDVVANLTAAKLAGARATGGPVTAGQSYLVGEMGRPEVFVPRASGTIVPSVDAFLASQRALITAPTASLPDTITVRAPRLPGEDGPGGLAGLVAAVEGLGERIDGLRADLRDHQGDARGQRARIADGAEAKLSSLRAEIADLPNRIAGAVGR